MILGGSLPTLPFYDHVELLTLKSMELNVVTMLLGKCGSSLWESIGCVRTQMGRNTLHLAEILNIIILK